MTTDEIKRLQRAIRLDRWLATVFLGAGTGVLWAPSSWHWPVKLVLYASVLLVVFLWGEWQR